MRCENLEKKYCHGPTGNPQLQLHSLSSSTASSSSNPLSPNVSVASSLLSSPTSPVFSQGAGSGPLVVKESEAKLKDDFTSLLWKMSEKLIEMNVNMKDLCYHVEWLFPGDCIPTRSDPEPGPKEIFSALMEKKLMNHLNYNPPLESIAKKFDKTADSLLLDLVENYKVKRTAFVATTSLADFISKCENEEEADPDEPLDKTKYDKAYFRKLRLKLKIMITIETIEYIDDLWRSLADEFLLPSLSALLDKVISGSLTIVWLVQENIIQKILERIPVASDFFRRHHITEVFIDDACVYRDTEQLHVGLEREHTLPRRIDERSTGLLSEYVTVLESETLEEHETTEQLPSTRPTMWKRFTNLVQSGTTWAQVGVLNMRLIWAAKHGNVENVQKLLKKGAEPNCKEKDPYRWTPLMWASHNGHCNVAKVLLQNGADPNIGATANWTALILSSRNGHYEVVKLLLDNGAVVNEKNKFGWNSLMWASQCRDYYGAKISTDPKKKANLQRVCVLLLSKGADPNVETKNGWTPVMQASQDGHAEFAKLLAESGADLDHLEKKKETCALMVAATKGHTEVVEALAACGANLDLRNKKQQTALHVACYKGHMKIVEKFIQHNADLNVKDSMGLTPIMIATKCGNQKITKLLTKRVDLNIQAEKYANWTALMFAVKDGNLDSVKLLLQNGANVYIKDSNNQSVVGIAKTFNHWQKIKRMMQEFYSERTRVGAEYESVLGAIQSATVGAQLEPGEKSTAVHQTTDIDQLSRAESDTAETEQQPTSSATKEALEEDVTVTSVKHDTDKRKKEQKFLIEEERSLSRTVFRDDLYKSYESRFNEMMLPTIAAAA